MRRKLIIFLTVLLLLAIGCAEIKHVFNETKSAADCKLECSKAYLDCRDRAGDNIDALAVCNEVNDACIASCEQ